MTTLGALMQGEADQPPDAAHAARLLEMAARDAEAWRDEARAEADAVRAEAHAEADRVRAELADVRRRHEAELAELQQMAERYREDIRRHLTALLEQVEGTDPTAES